MQIAVIIMGKFDEKIDQILSFSADIISMHSDCHASLAKGHNQYEKVLEVRRQSQEGKMTTFLGRRKYFA